VNQIWIYPKTMEEMLTDKHNYSVVCREHCIVGNIGRPECDFSNLYLISDEKDSISGSVLLKRMFRIEEIESFYKMDGEFIFSSRGETAIFKPRVKGHRCQKISAEDLRSLMILHK